MEERISQEQYRAAFEGEKNKKALEHALEIRKFEIDLYWKRAAYFWTFIAVTFAGYGAIQESAMPTKTDLAVFVSCLGLVFSFGWFCVNKGSKQWQENWENHVDLLEDDVVGPLYKIVLKRPQPRGVPQTVTRWITGPEHLSVSKINQIISLFVTVLWVLFLWKSLPPFSTAAAVNWEYVLIIGATFAACIGFVTLGRTHLGAYRHFAIKRRSEIDPPNQNRPC